MGSDIQARDSSPASFDASAAPDRSGIWGGSAPARCMKIWTALVVSSESRIMFFAMTSGLA
jgi:hypothetical protein